jgi:hypothetical protein
LDRHTIGIGSNGPTAGLERTALGSREQFGTPEFGHSTNRVNRFGVAESYGSAVRGKDFGVGGITATPTPSGCPRAPTAAFCKRASFTRPPPTTEQPAQQLRDGYRRWIGAVELELQADVSESLHSVSLPQQRRKHEVEEIVTCRRDGNRVGEHIGRFEDHQRG